MFIGGADGALSPLNPYLIQITVDKYIIGNNWGMLLRMTEIIFRSPACSAALTYNFTYNTNFLGQSIVRDLRTRVYSHVLGLILRHFDRTPIGTSVTRTITDVEAINRHFRGRSDHHPQ